MLKIKYKQIIIIIKHHHHHIMCIYIYCFMMVTTCYNIYYTLYDIYIYYIYIYFLYLYIYIPATSLYAELRSMDFGVCKYDSEWHKMHLIYVRGTFQVWGLYHLHRSMVDGLFHLSDGRWPHEEWWDMLDLWPTPRWAFNGWAEL
jgi:hypothetical protein